jgi:hypothetical protein
MSIDVPRLKNKTLIITLSLSLCEIKANLDKDGNAGQQGTDAAAKSAQDTQTAADTAAKSADDAKGAASAALESVNKSSAAEHKAETAASNALHAESNAKTSADAAAKSAQDAQTAADTAAKSAKEAHASQQGAETAAQHLAAMCTGAVVAILPSAAAGALLGDAAFWLANRCGLCSADNQRVKQVCRVSGGVVCGMLGGVAGGMLGYSGMISLPKSTAALVVTGLAVAAINICAILEIAGRVHSGGTSPLLHYFGLDVPAQSSATTEAKPTQPLEVIARTPSSSGAVKVIGVTTTIAGVMLVLLTWILGNSLVCKAVASGIYNVSAPIQSAMHTAVLGLGASAASVFVI